MHDFEDSCPAEDDRLSRSAWPRRKRMRIKVGSEPHKELFCRHLGAPVAHHQYANISIFDMETHDALHAILSTLPLFPFMEISVTPLARQLGQRGGPCRLRGWVDGGRTAALIRLGPGRGVQHGGGSPPS
jgi:muconolactone delta-isomerase